MSGLFEELVRLEEDNTVPMHMPGHKRNAALADYLNTLCCKLDITEIDGFDNLHSPEGILLHAEESAARLWGSGSSFLLVNGSTVGILAALRAAAGDGKKVITARNCHKSVYHALELCRSQPIFIMPKTDTVTGISASINPEAVRAALEANPDAALVVITSPTYEGVISDISSICRIAHSYGVPVLVDEAHGAHLSLSDYFPGGAVSAGADLTVQSLHKTLPSLTQTALLHLSGNHISEKQLRHQLNIFETSSPSYLLLASIDSCVRLLRDRGGELYQSWEQRLESFYTSVKLENLYLLKQNENPLFFAIDCSKLVVSTHGCNISAAGLSSLLRSMKIETEAAYGDILIAMTGMGDTDENINRFADAILKADSAVEKKEKPRLPSLTEVPERILPSYASELEKYILAAPENSEGSISAGYLWAYPPGIPLIVPGERIDGTVISLIKGLCERGTPISGMENGLIPILQP